MQRPSPLCSLSLYHDDYDRVVAKLASARGPASQGAGFVMDALRSVNGLGLPLADASGRQLDCSLTNTTVGTDLSPATPTIRQYVLAAPTTSQANRAPLVENQRMLAGRKIPTRVACPRVTGVIKHVFGIFKILPELENEYVETLSCRVESRVTLFVLEENDVQKEPSVCFKY